MTNRVGDAPRRRQDRRSGRDWLLVVAVVGAIVGGALTFLVLYDSTGDFGQIDYRVYTGSASRFVHGGSLYDYVEPHFHLSATYPPIGPLLFVPLSFLGPRVGEAIWLLANLACVAGIGWLVCANFLGIDGRRRVRVTLIGVSLAVPTMVLWRDLNLGQINLWLWLAILGDLVLVRRNSRYAGLLIGVAAAVKLVPAIFIVFLVSIRAWRAAGRAIAGLVGLTAVGWLIAPADTRLYWTSLLFDTSRIGPLGDGQNNSIRFVTALLPIDTPWQVAVWLVAVAVIVPLGLWQATRHWRQGHDLYAVVIVGCVGALASPISWNHHLIFLLLALLLAPVSAWAPEWQKFLVVGAGWLVLVDPVADGVNRVTAAGRVVLMLMIVAGALLRPTSWLVDRSDDLARRDTEGEAGGRLAAGRAVL